MPSKPSISALIAFLLISVVYSTDPCLEYQNGTNHCKNCSEGYKFALINETTTLCAYTNKTLCWLNDTFYENDTAYNHTFEYLRTYTVNHEFCFNCTSFFQLESGENLCYSGCPKTEQQDFIQINIEEQAIGCHTCALEDYQMRTILDYSFIELYVKTCTKNVADTACNFQEYFDPEKGRCVACIDKYPKCASCDENHCIISVYQYYSGINMFNYTSREFEIDALTYFLCSSGTGSPAVGNICKPSSFDNCYQSFTYSSGTEICYICAPGYYYSYPGCKELDKNISDYTYFVKSGAVYNGSTSESSSQIYSDGTVDEPLYFLAQAIQYTINKARKQFTVNMTIYLGKGDLFFFYCNRLSGSIFNAPEIIQYCWYYYYYLDQGYVIYDNIHMHIKPLYCSLAEELNFTNNTNFTDMCINKGVDPDPTIYVNQAHAYFQIFGTAIFENIHFSGVNQLVQPVITSNDLSSVPLKLCNVVHEPAIGDQFLNLEKMEHEDFNINYKCINQNYTGSEIPQSLNSSYTCERNQYLHFYRQQESTFSCSGEPSYDYYFYGSYYDIDYYPTPRRTNTLFNLIAMPEYLSGYQQPPALTIINCTFEYFLANYESLINVQTQDFYKQAYTSDQENAKDKYTFVASQAGERGAKIKIQDSSFRHSSFCKGLIVYRKQPYLNNDQFAYGNFSYYLMTIPYVQDEGSYIILENSRFTNINSGFQNISALAIYGGQEVWRTMDFGKSRLQYQGFIHKGSILNIEDFGGFVGIQNCTIEYNMHFIPQILNAPLSSFEQSSVADFADSSQTGEYKMAICDENSGKDKFFFSHGLSSSDDIDSFYDAFERVSTIYISRNREGVVIKNNTFHSNVGTFGGAISINSQNWDAGKEPFIMIEDNNFTNNMAYLSGNAIYIRNSIKGLNETSICGGMEINRNLFSDNVGGSTYSNGGALSISCNYLSQEFQDDFYSSSSQFVNASDESYFKDAKMNFTDKLSNNTELVHKYTVNIENNTFKQNLAGAKGSALYLKKINSVRIKNCTFEENGPILSQLELNKSPYVKYLTKRSLAFYDPASNCSNEFEYVAHCQPDQFASSKWSHVYGAVYMEHCQSKACLSNNIIMELEITDTVFNNNQVGYIMDAQFPYNLSSQIQIVGGFNNTIHTCSFMEARGLYKELIPEKLLNFFPHHYFEFQQASLLAVTLMAEKDVSKEFRTVVKNCTFQNNKHFQSLGLGQGLQYQGSLIRVTSPNSLSTAKELPILTLENSHINGNVFIGENSQLIYAQNALIQVRDSTFNHNGGILSDMVGFSATLPNDEEFFPFTEYESIFFQDYGLIQIEGMLAFSHYYAHLLSNNTFSNTFARHSSILHMNFGNQFMNISGNQFENNIALIGGIISTQGAIHSNLYGQKSYLKSVVANSTILIENNSFHKQISYYGIFSLILSDSNLKLNLFVKNSTFGNNFQYDDYSLFSFQDLRKVIISDSYFFINKTKEQMKEEMIQAMQDYPNGDLQQIIDLIFESSNVNFFAGSKFLTANSTLNTETEVYFQQDLQEIDTEYFDFMEIKDCSFDTFFSAKSGSLIHLSQDSKLMILNTQDSTKEIFNCSVGQNGIIYLSSSQFVGKNLMIRNSKSAFSTALFYLTQHSSAQVFNSEITNNYAHTYGMAYITGSSNFLCDECLFFNNSVEIDSSTFYADNNPSGFITIRSSRFISNNSTSNLMSLVSTETLIENSQFIDNFSKLINNGITLTNSKVTLNNVTVNYTDNKFISENDFQVDTCFFNVNFQSVITLSNSIVQNCRGGTAGVLQASGHSSVYIKNNSMFLDNKSSVDGSGSALYFLTTNEVAINNSFFSGNGIIDIYVQRSKAVIANSSFARGQRQFVYGQASGIEIIGSHFKDSQNQNLYGLALYCYCYSLSVQNSTFQNLSAVKGGAIYLTSQVPDSYFSLENNIFEYNTAQQGGAVFVQDAAQFLIKKNVFKHNSAKVIQPLNEETINLLQKGLGGAIFFSCQNLLSKLANNCTYQIVDWNQFLENYAENDGGAIIRVSNEIQEDNSTIFERNQAKYGENQGTFPSSLDIIFLRNNDYYDPVDNTQERRLTVQDNLKFEKIVSGTEFAFLVYILDQEGNVYYTDNESIATLKNQNSSVSVLLNGNEVKASNGLFNFSQVTAITQPGSNLTLTLEVQGMYDFGNTIPFIENPITIDIQFRECVSGEEMLNSACEPCPVGFYLYEAPTENTNCKACEDDSSVCKGKNIVYPRKGFWRESSYSEDWILCPRTESCLEGDSDHLTAHCLDGYTGIVCGVCEEGHSKTGDFKCDKCPDRKSNIVKITFIFLFVVLVVIALVFSTFSSSGKAKSGYSVYIKIMTSHFQIISAIANVNFDWPQYIEKLYNSLVSVSQVSEQIFSIDCFLVEATSPLAQNVGIYFTKLLVFGILPVLLAGADVIFWLIFSTIKGTFKNFWNHFVSTLVILLFLVHPTITQEMFQAFNCVKIGEVYYLRDDIEYECYTGQHLYFLLIIVIPSIILWCLGIPLFALIILLRNKKLILREGDEQIELTEEEKKQMQSLRLKFGFIFNGFKSQTFYYEVVIQYRKVVLIMVTVILSVVSPEIQALLSFLILILGMIYQYQNTPFLTATLNRMELLSLMVATTTMYSGMYFITGQHYDYNQNPILQWVFLVLLIVPNLAFFLYWLYYMIIEIYKLAHRKSRRFFCIISLGLCNYDKFRSTYMIPEQARQNAVVQPPAPQNDFQNIKPSTRGRLRDMINEPEFEDRSHQYQVEAEEKSKRKELKDSVEKKEPTKDSKFQKIMKQWQKNKEVDSSNRVNLSSSFNDDQFNHSKRRLKEVVPPLQTLKEKEQEKKKSKKKSGRKEDAKSKSTGKKSNKDHM